MVGRGKMMTAREGKREDSKKGKERKWGKVDGKEEKEGRLQRKRKKKKMEEKELGLYKKERQVKKHSLNKNSTH